MREKAVCLLFFLSALPPALFSAELPSEKLTSEAAPESPREDPLEKSLSLIEDTISLVESMRSDNELLKSSNGALETALQNVLDMLQLQGQLLKEQAETRAGLSEICEKQRNLLNRELKRGRLLKWSLIISAPACAGLGIWLGIRIGRR